MLGAVSIDGLCSAHLSRKCQRRRDLLRAAGDKLYHMGIRGKVSRNTLAHANEVRDWRIYQDFAQVLIQNARELFLNDPLKFNSIKRPMHSIPPSWICVSRYSLGRSFGTQGRREASYPSGLTCQHPHHSDCHYGSRPRRKHHGRAALGARVHLRNGPRICRLLSALPHPARFGFLCHTSQEKTFASNAFTPTESTNPRAFAAIKPWCFAAFTPKRIIPKNCAASVTSTSKPTRLWFS